MDPIELAWYVLPVTALLYGRLALHDWRRERWYRRAVDHCAAQVRDPYHAVADRWWPEDDIQAAAARLLLDGLVTVNYRGNLSLTAAGRDPEHGAGHPLPDALLATLRRRTAAAALGNIMVHDTAFRAAREKFHADYRARHAPPPGPATRDIGCLGVFGVLLFLGQFTFCSVALLSSPPHGPLAWTASCATGLALIAQISWLDQYTDRHEPAAVRDPFAERLAQIGPHPALAELAERDPESAERLRISRTRSRRGRNRGRPRRHRRAAGIVPDNGLEASRNRAPE
ncbi:hypothetical protein [Streptomyces olivochromogenes]|uniref:hypothetical protein n=1 Tax=Streptomyces olivochromogenes TaxID=1963 RepID=UPI001F3F43CF|nr:hypothetical protein [Streptomyces olivochromogenes]MCF3130361.1 hypothetical protein [Streptomyces olivochromogenes]